ncbi:MAG TPA: histidine kinase [Nocardioidaceae bacterium]|nr:histidine kinase [Nocardioidaceae bacterium]
MLDRVATTGLDAALTGAFLVAGLAQGVVSPLAEGWTGHVFVLGSTLPLAWRRTRPLEAALVASAFWLIPLDGFPVLGFVVVVLQCFGVGSRGEPTAAVVGATAWASCASAVGTLLGPEAPVAVVGSVLVVVAPVLAGRLVHHLRQQNDRLTTLSAQLREERQRAEEAAVGSERARIAHELHDVVGHEVTLIAIQAEAASAALRQDPRRAAEPVEAIRTTAHRTLTEIRSVLDLLSPTETGDRSGADGLAAIADRARAAGILESLTETGTPPPDSSPVSMAVRRIVQEGLTNAGRHAPQQPVSVQVDWTGGRVEVTVTNPVTEERASVPGRGLSGIGHRARLLGGSSTVEVRDGVFVVRVRMPTGVHA